MKYFFIFVTVLFLLGACSDIQHGDRQKIADEMQQVLTTQLHQWYPGCLDNDNGGYLCHFNAQWQPIEPQRKMIVTQARHLWTSTKAAKRFPEDSRYEKSAEHGYPFLRDDMWDDTYGGFYFILNRQGDIMESGYKAEKRTYGLAFGLYATAAYAEYSGDESVLEFTKDIFRWIEEHAYDPEHGGYFQFLKRDGTAFLENPQSTAGDSIRFGLKDQNTTIHLLEAYSQLYKVWPDDKVRTRLKELLVLIRDTITTKEGYLVRFFRPDWTPITFQDSAKVVRKRRFDLMYISYGHDVETAYLLLEAASTLGLDNDARTDSVAKKLVDFSLKYGWDEQYAGFVDAGYYYPGDEEPKIARATKNWWSQAEGLNALLLMSLKYPDEEKYYDYFVKLWNYTQKYLIDQEHGGWYEGGLDRQPDYKDAPKGHIWKGGYHTSRALMNCIDMLGTNQLFDNGAL